MGGPDMAPHTPRRISIIEGLDSPPERGSPRNATRPGEAALLESASSASHAAA